MRKNQPMSVKNLVIVESPAKAKTIERFLGNEFKVMSSYGHVRDLPKGDLSIDINNGYLPQYEVLSDKTKLISELKKLCKEAEIVWLATDEDREGEAISWHLVEALKLPIEKTQRIVFHEITKEAIQNAIKNPRSLDNNLVNAQQARRVLDRLVGYELSPILWKKVRPSLSAGRVQSVAVRLIVEREEEINQFDSVSDYKITGDFISKGDKKSTINAELDVRFDKERDALVFLESCSNAEFTVSAVETKPGMRSPAAPFTTSTLQQEASRKLGFSVSQTMTVAQQLYEEGHITYMRTDSVHLSDLALNTAAQEIRSIYGEEYSKTRQFVTKSKGAQEAHEAIRPTYLAKKSIDGNSNQKKLYDLIWKRTIASQMAEARIEKTQISIDISNNKNKFIARGEVILFDGFLKVYEESVEDEIHDESSGKLPALQIGTIMNYNGIHADQKFSQHPPRYSEASLVKKLEELGIGRPSTYAPTISTIQKREYVIKESRTGKERKVIQLLLLNGKVERQVKTEKYGSEKNKLFPTDLGILVNRFLVEYFPNIVDYHFTANVEKEFDEIADGKIIWEKPIDAFYKKFKPQVEETLKNASRVQGERLLGIDPKSGKNIYAKYGPYGPMVQIGESTDEEKPRFASLLKGQSLEKITYEEAIALFGFPKTLGDFEDKEVVVSVGRFGPYVRHDGKFYSIPSGNDPGALNLKQAIEIIDNGRNKAANSILRTFDQEPELKIVKGRFGPYIKYKGGNYPLGKKKEYETLSIEEIMQIIAENSTKEKPAKKTTKKAKK